MAKRSLQQIEESLRNKLAEASVMDQPYPRDMRNPEYRAWLEKQQALGSDPVSDILVPGVSQAQSLGDLQQSIKDKSASGAGFAMLGLLPFGVGKAAKAARAERALAKAEREAGHATGKFPDVVRDFSKYDRPTVSRKSAVKEPEPSGISGKTTYDPASRKGSTWSSTEPKAEPKVEPKVEPKTAEPKTPHIEPEAPRTSSKVEPTLGPETPAAAKEPAKFDLKTDKKPFYRSDKGHYNKLAKEKGLDAAEEFAKHVKTQKDLGPSRLTQALKTGGALTGTGAAIYGTGKLLNDPVGTVTQASDAISDVTDRASAAAGTVGDQEGPSSVTIRPGGVEQPGSNAPEDSAETQRKLDAIIRGDTEFVRPGAEDTKSTLGVNESRLRRIAENYIEFISEENSNQDEFLRRVIKPESGGRIDARNPRSTAKGLLQITKGTWEGLQKQAAQGSDLAKTSWANMEHNVDAQYQAGKMLAKEYANIIKQHNLPDLKTSYYMLHNFGNTGVKLMQNPNSKMSDIIPLEIYSKKAGKNIPNPIWKANEKEFGPNTVVKDIIAKRAKSMGEKGNDVIAALTGSSSARAGELPRSAAASAPAASKPAAAKPAAEKPVASMPQVNDDGSMTLSPADIAKLPPVERFGHILPGVNFNKQGGISGFGTRPYILPDGTVITDPSALRDIYNIQQRQAEKAKQAAKSDSFIDKAKRVLSGELPSQVFSPKPAPAKVEPAKQAAEKPAATAEPAKPTAVKAEPKVDPKVNVRKEFEKAFAAARKEKGPEGEFTWTNPESHKTGTYTTRYKEEPVKKSAADKATDDFANELDSTIKYPVDSKATSDRDRIADLVNKQGVHYPEVIKQQDTENEIKESVNTELQDLLKLAGRK